MPKAGKNIATKTGLGEPFELVAVEESKAPGNGVPGTWSRYTIAQGDNIITGHRKGSRAVVTRAVEEIVADLNERRVGRRGRVHLTSSSKPKASGS